MRPTKRALDDIGEAFPTIDVELSEIDHPLVVKSQNLPPTVSARGGERVISLSDRVWFKVKVNDLRAVAARLSDEDLDAIQIDAPARWWLGAAGPRRDGDHRDFYQSLAVELARYARGSSAKVNSARLLPQAVDRRRLLAESAFRIDARFRHLVVNAIARSALGGGACGVMLDRDGIIEHDLCAKVHAHDGESYLAISAEGFIDPRMIALVLNAVPGVDPGEWAAEPSGVDGVDPMPGQIIYSTIIPTGALDRIIELHQKDGSP